MTDLEAVMLEDTRVLLARWRREFAGRPGAERERLLLLALEREQIVAVAYREEAVAGRVAELDVGAAARALIRQTLMWIWKDEQLHFEFMRGLLLELRLAGVIARGLRPGGAGHPVRVDVVDRDRARGAVGAAADRGGRRPDRGGQRDCTGCPRRSPGSCGTRRSAGTAR